MLQIIIKYGVNNVFENEDIKKKSRETCLRNIGVEYFIHSVEYKKKMIQKYGVEYPLQNDSLFSKFLKSSKISKEYIFENGTTIMILGYEYLAIKELEYSKMYKIIEAGDNKKIPTFWYDFENKKHKYYPDIYIPEINTIIEVKSTYYFEKDMIKNISKAKEVSKSFIFLVYVYSKKKVKKVYKLENSEFIEV